ncbi:MAG: tRNA uridine-5-carboxymethylaminomethyl(34) synthesis GTPase MnmE, partial [Proteiniphilum sp.]|nr:tRNA uridine-5-carboxymethylaminomethyl(34) synthesis GTPase MnmE [Proteiniphilum sp.]
MSDIICAVSTPPGMGAIAVIRLSGEGSGALVDRIFHSPSGKKLSEVAANTVHFGEIVTGDEVLDEALVTVFRAPRSFTGEESVEISCHGSAYVRQRILQLLIEKGARSARPGEFTQRAFLNGKIDLSQAEAVADLIASTSAAMHRLAISQMRGGFSEELAQLRQQLLDFTTLVELELDFAEEDVEFADRRRLEELALEILRRITLLADSFDAGNAVKNGIPVAIVGKPNVGKSTLLNGLLREERAIVSDIPGTTRDTVEETVCLHGQQYRLIDTAGLRQGAADRIEAMGIRRSVETAQKASVILYLFDLTAEDPATARSAGRWLFDLKKPLLMVGTKNDLARSTPPGG